MLFCFISFHLNYCIMNLSLVVGYIGADADVKQSNGKEFVTFRVAHSERWTDQQGQSHENTTWYDCIMQGKPAVCEYLKRGTMVCVMGSESLRIYSSPKDRCMKAGATINVQRVELLGGKPDEVPSRLYRTDNGQMVTVVKYYGSPDLQSLTDESDALVLTDNRGGVYHAFAGGWIQRVIDQDSKE